MARSLSTLTTITTEGTPRLSFPKKDHSALSKPEFFDFVEDEYSVCRQGVGLIDMSSFAKFIVKGASVVNCLQSL